jgi:hypothetical protein
VSLAGVAGQDRVGGGPQTREEHIIHCEGHIVHNASSVTLQTDGPRARSLRDSTHLKTGWGAPKADARSSTFGPSGAAPAL